MGPVGLGREAESGTSTAISGTAGAGGSGLPASTMVTILGTLLLVGSAAAWPATLLDHTPGARHGLILALIATMPVAGVVLLIHGRRAADPPEWAVHVCLVSALAVTSLTVWAGNGAMTSVAALGFTAWLPLFALVFLPTARAVPYAIASVLLSVLVIVLSVHEAPVWCGIQTVGTTAAAAFTAWYFHRLLQRSSTTDPLTGLPNRQALAGIVDRELARSGRQGTPVSLAVVDLDSFKEVNDREGHRAGDELLKLVSSRWRRGLRPGDEMVRYGGDEFIVLLPGCDASDGARVIDGLRRSGQQPCSVGVAQWVPGEPIESTLADADAALYEVKRAGGDSVLAAPQRHVVQLAGSEPARRPRARRWRVSLSRFDPTTTGGTEGISVRVKVAGWQFIAGGAVAMLELILDPPRNQTAYYALADATGAVFLGVALLILAQWRGERMTMLVPHAAVVSALVGVGIGCVFVNSESQVIVVLGMLSWSYMYVFALFPWRMGISYCVLGSLLITAVIAVTAHHNPVGVALISITTTAGAGVLVGYVQALFRRQSLVDALTALPNRGALETIMRRETSIAGRVHEPLIVGLIDLDGFKQINDTEGHLAGDGVLASFARLWRTHLRLTDSLVRYGGDEFVLLMPGCQLADAVESLERIRRLGAQACSIGLTEWVPGDTGDTVLARADAALYLAKERGRDRIATLAPPALLIAEAKVA